MGGRESDGEWEERMRRGRERGGGRDRGRDGWNESGKER